MLVALVAVRSTGSEPVASPTLPPTVVRIDDLGGLVITGIGTGPDESANLERSDPEDDAGPYSVVVRRADGDLADATAVVTYPVHDLRLDDDEIRTNRSTGVSTATVLRPDGRVVVRGIGLSADELTAIADATSTVSGRPVINSTAVVASFTVVATGP